MKLSLIICIYNTERHYFDECLSSLFSGTLGAVGGGFSPIDFEVLIIDDGSEVDYSDILKKYPTRHIKTSNNGIFKARLAGIAAARGEYIAFMDSDDTVSFNYHRSMLYAIEQGRADIVINDWAFKTERSVFACKNDSTICADIYAEGEDALALFFEKRGREHSYYVVWNKLYRAEVMKRAASLIMQLGIPDGYNYSEDALLNFYAFAEAGRVTNLHTGYYFYRLHSSQSVNVISEGRLENQIKCMALSFGYMRVELIMRRRLDLLVHLGEWEALMSRTHYTYARRGHYRELYGLIRRSYGTERLTKNLSRDSYAYRRTVLLPDNAREIDGALLRLGTASSDFSVFCERSDVYTASAINGLRLIGFEIRCDKNAQLLPRPKISLLGRILHNSVVHYVSNMIFKKGSRIRAFLKRFF